MRRTSRSRRSVVELGRVRHKSLSCVPSRSGIYTGDGLREPQKWGGMDMDAQAGDPDTGTDR
jgi:hypothetical protein